MPALTRLKNQWGLSLLGLAGTLAVLRAVREPIPGHFRMAWQAGHALWTGAPAYGVPWEGNLYFYSPTCGMFLYSPFGLLPEKLGLLIFLTLSMAVFVIGLVRFSRHFIDDRRLQILGLILAPHLFASVAAHKTEVASTGLVLLSASLLIEKRRLWLSALAMGLTGNWKLQSLPASGLIAISQLLSGQGLRWALQLASSLALWFTLPFVFRPWSELIEAHRQWRATLSGYSRASFDFYDNLFSFMGNNFGLKMSFETSQTVTLAGAGACALLVGISTLVGQRRKREALSSTTLAQGGLNLESQNILLSVATGFSFTTLFSPLQQINAYLLIAPLAVAGLQAQARAPDPFRKLLALILCIVFGVLTFAYSELVPQPARDILRHAVVRAPAVLLLLIAVWTEALTQDFKES